MGHMSTALARCLAPSGNSNVCRTEGVKMKCARQCTLCLVVHAMKTLQFEKKDESASFLCPLGTVCCLPPLSPGEVPQPGSLPWGLTLASWLQAQGHQRSQRHGFLAGTSFLTRFMGWLGTGRQRPWDGGIFSSEMNL